MDKLSDIIGSIRERAANPFFVSFILSWLVVNWEIPVALFWPDLSQMQSLHYNTIFEYIQFILSKPDSFWLPVGLAAGYTILSPVVWNIVRWFNAWTTKWGNSWVFGMSKGSKVSFEHYYELMHENTEKGKRLDEMIDKQNELRDQRDTANNKADNLEKKLKAKEVEVDNLIVEQENTKKQNTDKIRETEQSLTAKNEIELNRVFSGKQNEVDTLNAKISEINKQYNDSFDLEVIQGVYKNKSDKTEVLIAKNTIHEKETNFQIISFYYIQSTRTSRFVGMRSIGQRNEYIYYEVRLSNDNTELKGIRNGEEYILLRQNVGLVVH